MNAAIALDNFRQLGCPTRCGEDEETVAFIDSLLMTAKAADLAGDFMQSRSGGTRSVQTSRGTVFSVAIQDGVIRLAIEGDSPVMSAAEALMLIGALTNTVNQALSAAAEQSQ